MSFLTLGDRDDHNGGDVDRGFSVRGIEDRAKVGALLVMP